MAREVYLADTSVFGRLTKPPVNLAFVPLAVQGKVAVCAPVAFELGFAARSPADYSEIMNRLRAFTSVPTVEGDQQRALEIQEALAAQSRHRAISLVDALV
ncbi:MAG TPA: VapC toxin family PIN domain ribonuclease, partial [Chloroflexota bacterium]|nr:VapC toxin family PIN domain ribonuclease [Chloroflexota bacterium]